MDVTFTALEGSMITMSHSKSTDTQTREEQFFQALNLGDTTLVCELIKQGLVLKVLQDLAPQKLGVLGLCVVQNHPIILDALLQAHTFDVLVLSKTLYYAIAYGKNAMLHSLMKAGADATYQQNDHGSGTPTWSMIGIVVLQGNVEMMKIMLDAGVGPNELADPNRVPQISLLECAVNYGSIECVWELMNRGAELGDLSEQEDFLRKILDWEHLSSKEQECIRCISQKMMADGVNPFKVRTWAEEGCSDFKGTLIDWLTMKGLHTQIEIILKWQATSEHHQLTQAVASHAPLLTPKSFSFKL